jgi:hypothetical protein
MHRGSDGWKPHWRRQSMVAQDSGRGTGAESADMGSPVVKQQLGSGGAGLRCS